MPGRRRRPGKGGGKGRPSPTEPFKQYIREGLRAKPELRDGLAAIERSVRQLKAPAPVKMELLSHLFKHLQVLHMHPRMIGNIGQFRIGSYTFRANITGDVQKPTIRIQMIQTST